MRDKSLLDYELVDAGVEFARMGERVSRCPYCQSLQLKLLEIRNVKNEMYECQGCHEIIR